MVKVAQVKDHASDEMVAGGSVRWQEKDGNEAAERAADLCRIRQPEQIMDATRPIQNASSFGYPIICELHRFFHCCCKDSCESRLQRRLRS